jgi:uncharacterized protein
MKIWNKVMTNFLIRLFFIVPIILPLLVQIFTTTSQAQTLEQQLSPAAQALVQRAFEGLDPAMPLADYHVHIIGNGKGPNGNEVNPAMLSRWHPFKRFVSNLYINASGVSDTERFDEEYAERLVQLARGFQRPIKLHIFAFDHFYNPDGTINRKKSEFYVPNEYVVRLSEKHPDIFVPVISVHPYRSDALMELGKWATKGVRYVKWLPNAQGMDPADPQCDAFYQRMRELGMILIAHTGKELAVSARGAQALGNPLRFRRALDAGLTIIMAHCASLGWNDDLDHLGKRARNFDLFIRLMNEEQYKDRLFGDISAMTQYNRMPRPMRALLRRPDIQARLVNGSDYPLPAIDVVIWTRQIAVLGMITYKERKALNEIYRANPLLYDFVLKRTLRDPKTKKQLAPGLFLENQELQKKYVAHPR